MDIFSTWVRREWEEEWQRSSRRGPWFCPGPISLIMIQLFSTIYQTATWSNYWVHPSKAFFKFIIHMFSDTLFLYLSACTFLPIPKSCACMQWYHNQFHQLFSWLLSKYFIGGLPLLHPIARISSVCAITSDAWGSHWKLSCGSDSLWGDALIGMVFQKLLLWVGWCA